MATVSTERELRIAQKRIHDGIAVARLRFETIINNNLFSIVLKRRRELIGFASLGVLQRLFSVAASDTQHNRYNNYHSLYQLIEVLAYFVYYCRIIVDSSAEAEQFLPGQSANVRIQTRLALEMLPQNLDTLSNTVRLLLAYVTTLERSTVSDPIYKQHPLLFKVEKLIFAMSETSEIEDFQRVYN